MKIFLSFTGLLRKLTEGELKEKDILTNSLFYFGCTREHAFTPGAGGEVNEVEWFEGGDEAHAIVIRALETAEVRGRVEWRKCDKWNSYEQLNHLLTRHDLPPVDSSKCYSYSYPKAQELILSRTGGVEVIF